MDWPPFYRAAMGRDFFDKQVPDLIKAVERLAAALVRLSRHEGDKPERKDGK